MLLEVGNIVRIRLLSLFGTLSVVFTGAAMVFSCPAPSQTQQPVPGTPPPANPPAASPQGGMAGSATSSFSGPPQQGGLNIVVLAPAHGGTDPGARGTGGMRESDIVLDFAM